MLGLKAAGGGAASAAELLFTTCLRIARRAVAGLLEDPTGGATRYHDRSTLPDWTSGREPTAEIGNRLFYPGPGAELRGVVVTPAESASEDAYVRRMRPTFGYIMALTWLAQMGAIAWVIVADPVQANLIITAMTSLGTIWSVGLSVLGIYVYKRSEDKRVSARRPER